MAVQIKLRIGSEAFDVQPAEAKGRAAIGVRDHRQSCGGLIKIRLIDVPEPGVGDRRIN